LLKIKVVAREGRSIPPSSRKAESPTGGILIFSSHKGRRKIKAGMTMG
jgi:hypothetical protein